MESGPGLILYVSWSAQAKVEEIPQIVKSLLSIRLLLNPDTGSTRSVLQGIES